MDCKLSTQLCTELNPRSLALQALKAQIIVDHYIIYKDLYRDI